MTTVASRLSASAWAAKGRAAYEDLVQHGAIQGGPCYCCGARFSRHRIWDALDAEMAKGATAKRAAREYGCSEHEALDVIWAYRWARRRHVALPGRGKRG